MAVSRILLPRIEGGALLEQETGGALRLVGAPPRGIEAGMVGRSPGDAVYFTQQVSADSGVSHALAAVKALEKISGAHVAHNGLLLRDLLHSLSLLHAHVRHFYFQVLPDYFPPSEWEKYSGPFPRLKAVSRGFSAKGKTAWNHYRFSHPFEKEHGARLMEHQARALAALSMLQRMMAAIGGKFPMVMSIVPGGVSIRMDEALVLKLRTYLGEIEWFLAEAPLADCLMVLRGFPDLTKIGKGGEGLLSTGSLGDETGPDASLFPKGILFDRALAPFQNQVVESAHRSFYRVPLRKGSGGSFLELSPEKPGAYSWIKAPRYLAKAMETGPLARLVITGLAGSRSHVAEIVALLEKEFKLSLQEANTAGGRLLALMGEVGPLVRWCGKILDDLKPGEPTVTATDHRKLTGEGTGSVEASAGAVIHRMVVAGGKVDYYDIIAPSTWNGGPKDADGVAGGLEVALNNTQPDIKTPEGMRTASRIVQSFFFSTSDAVQ